MFDVCPDCGAHTPEKSVEPDASDPNGTAAFAICPDCGHRFLFLRLPLFLVSGASGAGKSTVGVMLQARLSECVVLDADILWRKEFDIPEDGYSAFRSTWMRMAKNINQAGRPVVLCGATLPTQLEQHVQRRYFGRLHYLALVCKDERVLIERLERRPRWRYIGHDRDSFIKQTLSFNSWLIENAAKTQPPMVLVDTSSAAKEEVVREVDRWVRLHLGTSQQPNGIGGLMP
jgi:2-phosphoglycerate kinase